MRVVLFIVILFQSFLFGDYKTNIDELDKMKLNFVYREGTTYYYFNKLLHQSPDDASGAIVNLRLTEIDVRKDFYKNIIKSLIIESTISEMQDSSVDLYQNTTEIRDLVFNGASFNSELVSELLDFIENLNNKNSYRYIRKYYLGWHKNSTFKAIKNRLTKLSDAISKFGTTIDIGNVAFTISDGVIKSFIINAINVGIFIDKVELLQIKDSKKDPLITKALEELKIEFEQGYDSSLTIWANLMKDKTTNFFSSIKASELPNFFIRYSKGRFLYTEMLSELLYTFQKSPLLLNQHIAISSLLINNFGGISIFSYENLKKIFTEEYIEDKEDNQINKLKVFLFSMFFKNLNEITNETGWVEMVSYQIHGSSFPRDITNKLSEKIYNDFKNRFKQLAVIFPDIPLESEYFQAVKYLFNIDAVEGINGKFEAKLPITRAQILKIIFLARKTFPEKCSENYKDNAIVNNNIFTDINVEDWYAPYVLCANDTKIAKGYNDGSFQPNKGVTLAGGFKFIYNGLNIPEDTNEETQINNDYDCNGNEGTQINNNYDWGILYRKKFCDKNYIDTLITKSLETELNRGQASQLIYSMCEGNNQCK